MENPMLPIRMETKMKVLVVSDTHRHIDNLIDAIEREKPIDMLIHCGDMETTDDYLRSLVKCPVAVVAGNNDFFYDYAKEVTVPLGQYKGMVTHGHNYYISMGVEILANEARARGMDFAFFGHTHRPYYNKVNDVQLLNPGSISYPRQEGRKPSYAILNINGEEYDCEIKYIEK